MHISPRKAADGAPAARPPIEGGPSGLLAAQPPTPVRRQVNTAPGECARLCEDSLTATRKWSSRDSNWSPINLPDCPGLMPGGRPVGGPARPVSSGGSLSALPGAPNADYSLLAAAWDCADGAQNHLFWRAPPAVWAASVGVSGRHGFGRWLFAIGPLLSAVALSGLVKRSGRDQRGGLLPASLLPVKGPLTTSARGPGRDARSAGRGQGSAAIW